MQYLHLISEGFSQAHNASGTDQFNGLEPPLTVNLPTYFVHAIPAICATWHHWNSKNSRNSVADIFFTRI
jgi:hypothetical protein